MKTDKGIRCDCCGAIELIRKPLVIRGGTTTRPEGRDKFFDIVLPPSLSPVTGKPDGRYAGCAREDLPSVLVPLHLCPGCALDIRKVLEFKIGKLIFKDGPFNKTACDAIQISAIGDPMKLKPGPLREHLIGVKSRNIFPDLGNA